MQTNYNVDYFIGKFSQIPEGAIGTTQDRGCAYGQCKTGFNTDGSKTPEGIALSNVMGLLPGLLPTKWASWEPYSGTPARINNGEVIQYQQPTPKERILAALHDIKAMQQPAVKEVIRYVSVPETIKDQVFEMIMDEVKN